MLNDFSNVTHISYDIVKMSHEYKFVQTKQIV